MQDTLTYQFVDRLGRLEGRIELYEGGRARADPLIEASLYLLINTCILDADKASGVGSIIAYEAVAQLEYIQI